MAPKPKLARDKEYIAGGQWGSLLALRRALPEYIDDLTEEFGSDLYDRMMRDPAVSAAVDVLKLAVLADGVQLDPACEMPTQDAEVTPEEQADAETAHELKEFAQRMLDGMDTPIGDVAFELLDALAYGHKVAERVHQFIEHGQDAGKLGLKAIKCKSRKVYSFVVDEFDNLLGVTAAVPGVAYTPNQGAVEPEKLANFIPIDRLVYFANKPRNGDPRGTSELRAAYNPWYGKLKAIPEFFKYLQQFGTPAIVGKTPPEGMESVPHYNKDTGALIVDDQGDPVLVSAQYEMLQSLLEWVNGTVVVVPGGAEVELVTSQGEGQAFAKAFDLFDRQITLAILNTVRATLEAEHGSRADSATGQDVLGLGVARLKERLADALTRCVLVPLIELNFGPDAVRLAPHFCLAKAAQEDRAKLISAYASAMGSGLIHTSQLPGIDAELGLPARDMEAIRAEQAEQRDIERMQAGEVDKLLRPGASDPPADGEPPQ